MLNFLIECHYMLRKILSQFIWNLSIKKLSRHAYKVQTLELYFASLSKLILADFYKQPGQGALAFHISDKKLILLIIILLSQVEYVTQWCKCNFECIKCGNCNDKFEKFIWKQWPLCTVQLSLNIQILSVVLSFNVL